MKYKLRQVNNHSATRTTLYTKHAKKRSTTIMMMTKTSMHESNQQNNKASSIPVRPSRYVTRVKNGLK